MKKSSAREYQNLIIVGLALISILLVSAIILLIYNHKMTRIETVSKKISTISHPTLPKNKEEVAEQTETKILGQAHIFNDYLVVDKNAMLKNGPLDMNPGLKKEPATSDPKETNSQTKNVVSSSQKNGQNERPTSQSKSTNVTIQKSPLSKGQKVVYLTFDDGPQAVSTQILALLRKYHAKATFFMLDPNIKRYPNAVKEMVQEGHSIGSHGVTHDIHQIYRSPVSFVKEMTQTEATLKRITGKESHLIRVPYGSVPYMKPDFRKASDINAFIMWDWDIDSNDWRSANGQFVQSVEMQVKNSSNHSPIVVLMHEKVSTYKYLEKVLQYFQQNGYQMKAITEDLKPVQFKYRPN